MQQITTSTDGSSINDSDACSRPDVCSCSFQAPNNAQCPMLQAAWLAGRSAPRRRCAFALTVEPRLGPTTGLGAGAAGAAASSARTTRLVREAAWPAAGEARGGQSNGCKGLEGRWVAGRRSCGPGPAKPGHI